jgi:hypothetical protein
MFLVWSKKCSQGPRGKRHRCGYFPLLLPQEHGHLYPHRLRHRCQCYPLSALPNSRRHRHLPRPLQHPLHLHHLIPRHHVLPCPQRLLYLPHRPLGPDRQQPRRRQARLHNRCILRQPLLTPDSSRGRGPKLGVRRGRRRALSTGVGWRRKWARVR